MIDNMRRSWGVGVGILAFVFLGMATEQSAIMVTYLHLWCWLSTCFLLTLKGSVSK